MEQKKNVLIIDPPNELRFWGPFNKPVVTVMKLTNPSDRTILYKIKTTAPKRYCVRPNFGAILPNSYNKVEICLQPFVYDPNEKNKHKFMVQSLIEPEEECNDLNKLWKEMDPSQLMDAKLKCVFEMPPDYPTMDTNVPAAVEVNKTETSTRALNEDKISNLPASDKSDLLVSELRQVREENSDLRKEILNLKEQVIRLRCATVKPPMDEPYAPVVEKQIPVFYIALAVLAAFIGLLFGKYLL